MLLMLTIWVPGVPSLFSDIQRDKKRHVYAVDTGHRLATYWYSEWHLRISVWLQKWNNPDTREPSVTPQFFHIVFLTWNFLLHSSSLFSSHLLSPKHSAYAPGSEYLHLLFPMPRKLFLSYPHGQLPHFI